MEEFDVIFIILTELDAIQSLFPTNNVTGTGMADILYSSGVG